MNYRIMKIDECGTECCIVDNVPGYKMERTMAQVREEQQEAREIWSEEMNQYHYYEEGYDD